MFFFSDLGFGQIIAFSISSDIAQRPNFLTDGKAEKKIQTVQQCNKLKFSGISVHCAGGSRFSQIYVKSSRNENFSGFLLHIRDFEISDALICFDHNVQKDALRKLLNV